MIRRIAKGLSGGAAALLPFPMLLRSMPKSWNQLFLPFYHLISNDSPSHVQQLYAIRNTAQFEQDLDYLLKFFTPIDLDQLLLVAAGEAVPKGKAYFHLSFDDGLRECSEVIAPILLNKGIPASFFINSAFLDNKALMFRYKASLCKSAILQMSPQDRQHYLLPKLQTMGFGLSPNNIPDYPLQLKHHQDELLDRIGVLLDINFNQFLKEKQPYLNSRDIQKLLARGFSIGSHSHDHPHYYKLKKEEQLQQTLKAQQFLEKKFDLTHRIFAFPFTDYGVSKSMIDELTTELEFDLIFGGAGLKKEENPKHLQRFPMETQQYKSVQQLLRQEFFYYLMKAPFGKNRVQRLS